MNDAHLDDEDLSELLDGMADADAVAHGESCPECRGRISVLAKVRDAIAEPVAPRDPAAVDAAIGAALDARLPLLRTARPRRVPLWLAGAAAAVLAIGVAIPLASGLGRGSAKKSASSASSNGTSAAAGPSMAAGAESGQTGRPDAFGAGPSAGLDLGEQDDPAALAQALRGFQGGQATSAASTGTGAAAATGGSVQSPAPSPSSTALVPAAIPPSCADAAAVAVGSTVDRLRLQATLRWQGQPAVVFAFDNARDGHLIAAVLSVDGCRLLVSVTA